MIRRRRSLAWCALILGVAACATLRTDRGPTPEERMDVALAALEAEDYDRAADELVQIYTRNWDEPIGRQAFVTLAAVEMDPRNPDRRLGAGAELAGRHLQLPGAEAWTLPVTETLYLLALELGAPEASPVAAEDVARMGEERPETVQAAPPRPLPDLPMPPVTERIRELEQERNRLARRVRQLKHQAAAAEQRAAAEQERSARLEREIDRIRRTLEP